MANAPKTVYTDGSSFWIIADNSRYSIDVQIQDEFEQVQEFFNLLGVNLVLEY